MVWLYHSHVDEFADANSGLVGHIIVTRQGWAKPDGSPVDVDREYTLHFVVADEGASTKLNMLNIERYLGLTGGAAVALSQDADFIIMNQLHCINGWVVGWVDGVWVFV